MTYDPYAGNCNIKYYAKTLENGNVSQNIIFKGKCTESLSGWEKSMFYYWFLHLQNSHLQQSNILQYGYFILLPL